MIPRCPVVRPDALVTDELGDGGDRVGTGVFAGACGAGARLE